MAPTAGRRKRASTARSRKRRSRSKRRRAGPRVSDLILKAVAASHEPKGVSLVALKKALAGRGYNVKNNSRVNLAVRSLVKRGLLVQNKRAGARRLLKLSSAVRRPARRRVRRRRATKRAPRRVRRRRRRVKRRSAKRVTMRRRRRVRAAKRKSAKRRSTVRRRRRRRVARK